MALSKNMKAILTQVKQLIPPLDGSLHKGQSGRVGVLGGALDYTGAPFFAAISALRFGADLSHVICSPTAAGAIKTYSPDLIVHPILREDRSPEQVRPELKSLLSRLHVLVIGPGLGREPYMQSFAKVALSLAREQGMFVVLDADGLWMVGQDVSLIKGYRRAVVTPNVAEFARLSEQLGVDPKAPADKRAGLVSRELGGVTVLQKGATDIISVDTTGDAADLKASQLAGADAEKEKAQETVEVDVEGGLKRCGGQGDVLSGTVGTMLAWAKCYEDGIFGDKSIPASRFPLLASVGASMVTRTSSRRAFHKEGRGVVTQDMLPEIGKGFAEVFGEETQGQDKGKL
ncbi:Ribokinase-like protein [Mycena vitilis]|nr:Ribokinase-like protein [Mycena vitilis]